MAPLATAFVRVEADDQPFLHTVDKAGRDGGSSLHRHMRDAGSKGGRAFGDTFYKTSLGPLRALGVAAAGIFAGVEIGKFFKDSIEAARESNKQSAITTQVIKTTGNAAHVTAGQVDQLTRAIADKTGIDHAQIESGARLLLTYTGIRNEVGKGNDIFNQATAALTDMSVSLGKNASSGARALGRALNDPIKGTALLTRYGITFNDATKKQIETLVKHHNVLAAQKIILGELSTRFGGAAAASTNAGQKMHVAFHDLEETVGRALVPALDGLERIFIGLITKVGPKVGAVFHDIGKAVADFVHGFTIGIDGLHDPQTRAAQAGAVLYTVWNEKIRPALVAVAGFIRNDVLPALGNLAKAVQPLVVEAFGLLVKAVAALGGLLVALGPALKAVTGFMAQHRTAVQAVAVAVAAAVGVWATWTAVTKVWMAVTKAAIIVQAAFDAVMDANPVFLVVTAIAALAAGLIYAYKHSETFRDVVKSVFHTVGAVISVEVHSWVTIVHGIVTAFDGMIHFFRKVPGWIKSAFSAVTDAISRPFIDAFNFIIRAWDSLHFKIPKVHIPGIGSVGGETIGLGHLDPIGGRSPSLPGLSSHPTSGGNGRSGDLNPRAGSNVEDLLTQQNAILAQQNTHLAALAGRIAASLNGVADAALLIPAI